LAYSKPEMTKIADLLNAIVASLQAIPGLVTLLGDASHISAYRHQFPTSTSWALALHQLKPLPAILVLWRGQRSSAVGNIPSRAQDLSLLIRDGEGVDISDIWAAILDGVPTTGTGLKWMWEIHDSVYMIREPELLLQTLQITDTAWLDYHEARFSLTEKFAG